MDDLDPPETFTAFSGPKRLAGGTWPEVSSAAQQAARAGLSHIVVLSDLSGETRDFEAGHASPPQKPARGRPKLGVTAREVTLLPRHWDWLAQQPGGASAALRRLVEAARKTSEADPRAAQAAIHRAMTTLAGDLPGYEEALRCLYSGEHRKIRDISTKWPNDIGEYIDHTMNSLGL
jgi:hypothetical protein